MPRQTKSSDDKLRLAYLAGAGAGSPIPTTENTAGSGGLEQAAAPKFCPVRWPAKVREGVEQNCYALWQQVTGFVLSKPHGPTWHEYRIVAKGSGYRRNFWEE